MVPRKDEERETALEDAAQWDLESPVAYERPSREASRALVSVPFRPGEFQRVSSGADRAGVRLSVFIRTAALEKADALIEAAIYGISFTNENEFKISVGNAAIFPSTDLQGLSFSGLQEKSFSS